MLAATLAGALAGCIGGGLTGSGGADASEARPDAASDLADAEPSTVDGALPPDASTQPSDASSPAVDCAAIAANPAWEVCDEGPDRCAGVYTDSVGCQAFCAAAGLVCVARFGGEPGCQQEPQNPIDCLAVNDHASDWCECGPAEGGGGDCASDPGAPPVVAEIDYQSATYTKRHNWVLDCRPYAYTASGAEHAACDAAYAPDGTRTGVATFLFASVPRGSYDVYVQGRHTVNRNPAGALFIVDGHPAIIDQRDDAGLVWDFHGTYCLEGDVAVVLDSDVNNGSDSVAAARLTPAP